MSEEPLVFCKDCEHFDHHEMSAAPPLCRNIEFVIEPPDLVFGKVKWMTCQDCRDNTHLCGINATGFKLKDPTD